MTAETTVAILSVASVASVIVALVTARLLRLDRIAEGFRPRAARYQGLLVMGATFAATLILGTMLGLVPPETVLTSWSATAACLSVFALFVLLAGVHTGTATASGSVQTSIAEPGESNPVRRAA
jgi:hypothetical protein